jgi:hypothetical protein
LAKVAFVATALRAGGAVAHGAHLVDYDELGRSRFRTRSKAREYLIRADRLCVKLRALAQIAFPQVTSKCRQSHVPRHGVFIRDRITGRKINS